VRDVTNIAKAAQALEDWVLVVFGEPDDEFLKLDVKFISPKPRMEYLTSCLNCDIALNPLKLDERFHYSSSNRLYEFISLGIRVMATKAQTYVDKFGDDLLWISENSTAEEITHILKEIEKYPKGEQLRKYLEKYNWEDTIKNLVTKYEMLLN
jgi:glycosyltransferase involved in cell wall biosynthesis